MSNNNSSKVSAAGNDKNNQKKSAVNREEKQRDAKMDEQIEKLVKSLGTSATPEQKIASLAKNLLELEKEHHRQATTFKQNEKYFETVQREKEHLQKEYNKGVLIRDKLEQVCREQQKLMKSIKSESLTKIRDEEEKRKETQAHFQQSINEIFTTLGKNNEENIKLKEQNLEMTKKFKYLAEQYELREKQLEKINEQINLGTQLNEAKLAKVKMEGTIEKEILLKDKENQLEDLLSTKKTIIEMQAREKALKEQLNMYTEKYAGFQDSLKKSNDIFTTYKSEIEKMAKKTKTLEKECNELRFKYDKSNRTILEMASDKQAQDLYIGKASRQLSQLQKLCRTLQAERGQLIEVLKANNIERPAMPELPPEPIDIEPPPKSADKLDIMSKNCNELKKTLAQLQGQMNALALEKNAKPAAVAPAEKAPPAKKNKNKKPKNCPNKTETVPIVEETKINQIADRILKEGENGTDAVNGNDIPADENTNETVNSVVNNNSTETINEQKNEIAENGPKNDDPVKEVQQLPAAEIVDQTPAADAAAVDQKPPQTVQITAI